MEGVVMDDKYYFNKQEEQEKRDQAIEEEEKRLLSSPDGYFDILTELEDDRPLKFICKTMFEVINNKCSYPNPWYYIEGEIKDYAYKLAQLKVEADGYKKQ